MLKHAAAFGCLVLLGLGVGAAALAAGETTGTVSACATVTAATHTVAVDGTPAATVGGDTASQCATTTYTIPTVTNTVTQTVTVTDPGTTTAQTTTTAPAPTSYLLDDEFNGVAGSLPSSTVWGVKTGGSNGAAHWNGWNQISEDGQGDLVINAQLVSGTWQSGFLSSKTAFGGQPYTVDARAKLACGQGTWNAPIWTWEAPYGAAPGIENDVNEQLGSGQATEYHATLHNWLSGGGQQQKSDPLTMSLTLCNGFHDYSANVYADYIDYYLDGTLVDTITAAQVGLTNLTSYQQVANIDLNMGGWAGTIGSETSAQMLVDYIRVAPL